MNNDKEQNQTGEGRMGRACYPALPDGISRDEAIRGLREIVRKAEEWKRNSDPNFVCWPNATKLIGYLESNGFPPPDHRSAGSADSTKAPE